MQGIHRHEKARSPMVQLIVVLLGILYFLSPIDLFPDFFPLFGRLDDIVLLFIIYWNFIRKKPQQTWEQPRTKTDYGSYRRSTSSRNEQSSTRQSTSTPPKDPYRILEVPRTATLEEIKRAYRQQANRYHPDKVTHLGTEFQTLAKEKFQDIQWAYEELTRRHS
ncbi:hypothetical protein DSTSK_39030 [Desulforhabdus sp. TSK]|nr:hypothetical protein DSTSK_39030 [Desulforhabdus sp. TSK]